jgi:hypothetical protein
MDGATDVRQERKFQDRTTISTLLELLEETNFLRISTHLDRLTKTGLRDDRKHGEDNHQRTREPLAFSR